jgi:hypothetical protein
MWFLATFFIMKNIYKIANFNVLIEYKYNYTFKFLEKYLTVENCTPDIYISISEEELQKEYETSEIKILSVVESSCILRKLAKCLIDNFNTILFHASAVAHNGSAFLFTAKSGTGKSTHTGLLKELLGDEITYINDDKPFIKYQNEEFFVYGNPWQGKHDLGENISVKLKAIVKITRSKDNFVKELDTISALNVLLEQSFSYNEETSINNLLELINKMLNKVKFYELYCNKDISSAKVSYNEILKVNNED